MAFHRDVLVFSRDSVCNIRNRYVYRKIRRCDRGNFSESAYRVSWSPPVPLPSDPCEPSPLNSSLHSSLSSPQFFATSTLGLLTMAPYDFDAPDVDTILRSLDGKEFCVHRLILSLASPIFQGTFSLPQPTDPPSQIPSVDLTEHSDILQPFIQYLYPRPPPKISDISTWAALYTVADKYGAEGVMESLRDILIPRFLDAHPLRVYALASHWGLEEEAKIASKRALQMDISEEFPEEDARLMGGIACQKLCLLLFQRRDRARALVNKRPYAHTMSCACPSMDFGAVATALANRVSTGPWPTIEELYEEAAKTHNPRSCISCRNSYKNIHAWLSSMLEDLSGLPQTIE